MAKTSLLWSLERFSLIWLHGYPTLHCQPTQLTPGSPAASLRRHYAARLAQLLEMMPAWQRFLAIRTWPLAIPVAALVLSLVNGRFAAGKAGRGTFGQLADQLRLAYRYGIPPNFYYLFELYDPEKAAHAQEFLQRSHLKGGGLYVMLYKADQARKEQARILNDKIALTRFLLEHRVATIPLVAIVHAGAVDWSDPNHPSLPEYDLFVKPRDANGGRGSERWAWRDGRYHGGDGKALDAAGLTRHLIGLSRKVPCLVQRCLRNHPELGDLTAGALSTLRMYTMLDEQGQPEHIFTMLRMSRDPATIVDNVCRGGVAAAVDPATGTLGRATDGGMLGRTGWLDRHPTTGAPISGRRVPFWHEAVELALTAHRQIAGPDLAGPYLVGWDIGVTDAGPVIVEGNKAPDIEIEQRLSGPWGNARFGALLAYHLEAARPLASAA